MTLQKQMAQQIREAYFGGNWTAVNVKDALSGVTWKQATTKVFDLNTIAALVFHINYYISPALNVLHGKPPASSDSLSFAVPSTESESDWQNLVAKVMKDAESFAAEIEKLDETKFFETFWDEKYGNVFKNIDGIIEHTYYHLGQIVLIKKILTASNSTDQTNPDS
ncbi:MAG TPA: DUF1572 domain-containing protein [Hanamia sp.]|nr:DUF1572 domain-containing protein [Hanamia sp.]